MTHTGVARVVRHVTDAPALVWPPQIQLPSGGIKVVYLDLNHWIWLAKTVRGRPGSARFVADLDACESARTSGEAVFVLGAEHWFEMLNIKDPSQRDALAEVMERLTAFSSLVSRAVVMELELSAVLDRFARVATPCPTVCLLGRGIRHAVGLQSGLRVMGPTGDVTQDFRERVGPSAFDEFVRRSELQLERSVLRGPRDEEVASARAYGWNPEGVRRVTARRVSEERAQAARLDAETRWRRGRLRDVVAAHELIVEFQEILPRSLAARRLNLRDVAPDRISAQALVRSMPSTEVAIELKTAWHRDRNKSWEENDIHDIDALALAVPYCDVVVTEKACHHVLTNAGLGERMHTALLRRLEDLPAILTRWRPVRPTVYGVPAQH